MDVRHFYFTQLLHVIITTWGVRLGRCRVCRVRSEGSVVYSEQGALRPVGLVSVSETHL